MQVRFGARAGISMVEVIVALVLASVLGATATSAFVTQSRFYSSQEETDFARGVTRRAMTIMVSELRMLEQDGGIAAATSKSITVRAPYAMGVVCGNVMVLTISRMPVDAEVLSSAAYSGYAYRDRATGQYTYVEGASTAPTLGGSSICTAAGMSVYSDGGGNLDGQAMQFASVPTPAPAIGTTVFLYQRITYEFANSVAIPGRLALWRRIEETGVNEEIVAPFDTTAGFRFYVNDAAVPQADVPAALSTITGIELQLDAFGERAGLQRNGQMVPLTTSVFFKNRSTS